MLKVFGLVVYTKANIYHGDNMRFTALLNTHLLINSALLNIHLLINSNFI